MLHAHAASLRLAHSTHYDTAIILLNTFRLKFMYYDNDFGRNISGDGSPIFDFDARHILIRANGDI